MESGMSHAIADVVQKSRLSMRLGAGGIMMGVGILTVEGCLGDEGQESESGELCFGAGAHSCQREQQQRDLLMGKRSVSEEKKDGLAGED